MGLRISRMINKHDKPTNVLLTAQSRSLHKADHCTMYRQHLMFGIAAWRSCKCTGRLHLWKDRSSFHPYGANGSSKFSRPNLMLFVKKGTTLVMNYL